MRLDAEIFSKSEVAMIFISPSNKTRMHLKYDAVVRRKESVLLFCSFLN